MEEDNTLNVWLERFVAMAGDEENASGAAAEGAAIVNRRMVERRYPRRWRFRRHHFNHNQTKGITFSFTSPHNQPSTAERRANASFCSCHLENGSEKPICRCGEDDTDFEWVWDSSSKSAAVTLISDNREVKFHPEFSCGTAAVRGNQLMTNGQYYWEVKMTTPVYGTDMMIGIGTSEMDLFKYRYTFGSLLGSDSQSWALSYTGSLHHKGVSQRYTTRFGQGNIIGIHLDMWNGTLAFFKNRSPLGIAYEGLHGKSLYPMVSSTSARSGMKVVRSCSFESSLQFLCCMKLRQMVSCDESVLDVVMMPPGLKSFLENNLGWLLCSKNFEKNEKNAAATSRLLESKFKLEILKPTKDSKRVHDSDRYSSDDVDDDSESESNYKRFCVPFSE